MTKETAALPLDLEWEGTGPLHRYFVVDVFTETPLEGNQLGVFADGRAFSSDEMQRLARELGQSKSELYRELQRQKVRPRTK